MRWMGTEPRDADAHEGCECLACTGCQVTGCLSTNVIARLMPLYEAKGFARVLLCDEHGHRYVPDAPVEVLPPMLPDPVGDGSALWRDE